MATGAQWVGALGARTLVAAVLLAAGCGPRHTQSDMATCSDTFIGDPSLPPEAILVVTDGVSQTLVDVHDGDPVPLVRPPQGGQVTYAAARVRNMNRCAVQFAGSYRDPVTNNELAFDGRGSNLVVGADGWGRPDVNQLSSFANIAPCPDNDPTRDVQSNPAILQIDLHDQKGHRLTLRQRVVPTCTAADASVRALCVCECNRAPPSGIRMCNGNGDGGL